MARTLTLDTRSISTDATGKLVTFWVSFAYPSPNPDYPHVLFHEVADCTSHQLGLLNFTPYEEQSASANLQKLTTVNYFPVEPGSEGDAIYKAACGAK
jgi:hypothetical protein